MFSVIEEKEIHKIVKNTKLITFVFKNSSITFDTTNRWKIFELIETELMEHMSDLFSQQIPEHEIDKRNLRVNQLSEIKKVLNNDIRFKRLQKE